MPTMPGVNSGISSSALVVLSYPYCSGN